MRAGRKSLLAGALTVILASCADAEPVDSEPPSTTAPATTVISEPAPTTITTERPTTTTVEATTTTIEAAATERQFGLVKPFTIVIPPEWTRDENSTSDQLFIHAGPNSVFFGVEGSETTVDGWVQRLTEHPNLVTTDPVPAEVAGAPGQVLDVNLGAGASETGCPGVPCVNAISGGLGWHIVDGSPNRIWIVDVDGTAVMIAAEASEGSFESHVATIEDALATLTWIEE